MNYKNKKEYFKLFSIFNLPDTEENQTIIFDLSIFDNQVREFIDNNDENSFKLLKKSIEDITNLLQNKIPDFLNDFNQCKLMSNDIIALIEFDPPNSPLDLILPLLVNWTCKQNIGNTILAQQSIHDFLMDIILSENPDMTYHKTNAIRALFNIINDSILMQEIFIFSDSVMKISEIFTYQDENIMSQLMMLMAIIIDNSNQFPDLIDDYFFNQFISKCIFRFTNFYVSNAGKFDYYVFSNFILLSKNHLEFFIHEAHFDVIFCNIEHFYANNAIITNILNILSDIFTEVIKNDYDLLLLSEVKEYLNIKDLYQIYLSNDDINNEIDSSLLCKLFKLTDYYFYLYEETIDSFFDKHVYKLYLKSLTSSSYKIRFSAFKAIKSMISVCDKNKQTVIKYITNEFCLSLIDLLDSDSPEIVESALETILILLKTESKRKVIKIVRKMGDESFINIKELQDSESLSDAANEYCDEILDIERHVKEENYLLIFDYDEFGEEEEITAYTELMRTTDLDNDFLMLYM